MSAQPVASQEPAHDPNASLEKALIQEYLKQQGYTPEALKLLPPQLAETLLKAASRYASLKMEEVAARAQLVAELHDDSSPFKK